MAALAMERGDPEVSRFIDSYKLSQDAESRRAKYGGDTSLPLNSDGYEDKQRSLRDERHKDWLVQQEKPQVIRNALFEEQRQMEQEKLMARRRSPPRPAQPQQPQMDYNRSGEQARAEEKRDYQDYMKAKEERYWAMRGRPVTPAGGLDIGGYDRQVKETAHAKKKEYKEMLDQQQKEHMYLRARQEPEMAILDRNAQQSQYLANKPPPGPGHSRGRDEANKTETQTRPIPERPRYGQPPFAGEIQNQNEAGDERLNRDILERRSSPANQPPRSPKKPANPEWLQVPMNDGERPAELGTPLAETQRNNTEVRQQQQTVKPAEVVKNAYYSSDDYEKFQKEIQRKQGDEYRDFLSKKAGTEVRNRDWNFDQNGSLELQGDGAVQSRQRELRAERQKEYNTFMSQQKVTNPDRRHEFVDTANGPYGGVFLGLGAHDNRSDALNRERHQEYNESLNQNDKKYAGKERPSGRPNWAKDSIPNNTDRGRSPMRNQPPADQYQQMLDEKRREEASRRRYEDPEYQGRLAQGRDRGEAGPPRYGY